MVSLAESFCFIYSTLLHACLVVARGIGNVSWCVLRSSFASSKQCFLAEMVSSEMLSLSGVWVQLGQSVLVEMVLLAVGDCVVHANLPCASRINSGVVVVLKEELFMVNSEWCLSEWHLSPGFPACSAFCPGLIFLFIPSWSFWRFLVCEMVEHVQPFKTEALVCLNVQHRCFCVEFACSPYVWASSNSRFSHDQKASKVKSANRRHGNHHRKRLLISILPLPGKKRRGWEAVFFVLFWGFLC